MGHEYGLRLLSVEQVAQLDEDKRSQYAAELHEIAKEVATKDIATAVDALALCKLICRNLDWMINDLDNTSMKKAIREKQKLDLKASKAQIVQLLRPKFRMITLKVN